jgi:hypothetical protein
MILNDGTNVRRSRPSPREEGLIGRVADMTVTEVRRAVEAGEMDAAEVVAAEESGKRRAGVLSLAR